MQEIYKLTIKKEGEPAPGLFYLTGVGVFAPKEKGLEKISSSQNYSWNFGGGRNVSLIALRGDELEKISQLLAERDKMQKLYRKLHSQEILLDV